MRDPSQVSTVFHIDCPVVHTSHLPPSHHVARLAVIFAFSMAELCQLRSSNRFTPSVRSEFESLLLAENPHEPVEESGDLQVEPQRAQDVIVAVLDARHNDEQQGEHDVGTGDADHDARDCKHDCFVLLHCGEDVHQHHHHVEEKSADQGFDHVADEHIAIN